MLDFPTLKLIQHCAQECEYQRSGEMSVYWMLNAWKWAFDCFRSGYYPPDEDAVLQLGKLVEPQKNKKGYRKVGVRVGLDVKMPHGQVPDAMARLFKHGADLTAAEFFYEFEEIHPFVDGNGRTGNILYNWLLKTLDLPAMPPDLWNQGRIEGVIP